MEICFPKEAVPMNDWGGEEFGTVNGLALCLRMATRTSTMEIIINTTTRARMPYAVFKNHE